MGRQVGFFADAVDEAALLEQAEAIGLRVAQADRRAGERARLTSPSDAGGGRRAAQLQLARADLPLDRLTVGTGRMSRLGLTAMTHPLIELSRSAIEGRVVRNGRIYCESDDSATRKLFDRLARFIRTWRKADRYRFFVGPHTAEAATKGGIRLMHHREELHPR